MDKDMVKEIKITELKSLDKYGFYSHLVFPESQGGMANYHTHGLEKSKNHQDFQIVLPIDPKTAHNIFFVFVNRINKGESFKKDTTVSDIIKNFDIKLIEKVDGERKVLRVLLPDQNGNFPNDDECENFYRKQLEDLN